MAKKDLRSVAASLSSVASALPTQHVAPVLTVALSEPLATISSEELVQFSFGLRKSQRRELQRLAADVDMTMRAFILDALRDKGLAVSEADLIDLRKQK